MKKSILLLLLLGVIFSLQAQEKKEVSKNKPSVDVENLQLAKQLAKYGYKTFSASALIEAAKIMSSVKTQELKYESFKQGEDANDKGKKQDKDGLDISSILAGAKKYADGDAKLLASISAIEKANESNRGRVGGPGEMYGKVGTTTYDSYSVAFREAELAEIALSGDGDTDLDLYVYDANGNIIAQDTDYTDDCYVSWVPRWTGTYIIKIVNRGQVYNRYYLLTN